MASEATGAVSSRCRKRAQAANRIEAALRAEREMLREFEVRRAHPKKRHRAAPYLAAARRAALRRFLWSLEFLKYV